MDLDDLEDEDDALDNMVSDDLVERVTSGKSSAFNRKQPHDTKGSGRTDDEKGAAGKIPGEQNGRELDVFAENRPRNSEGEFLGEEDFVFNPFK